MMNSSAQALFRENWPNFYKETLHCLHFWESRVETEDEDSGTRDTVDVMFLSAEHWALVDNNQQQHNNHLKSFYWKYLIEFMI